MNKVITKKVITDVDKFMDKNHSFIEYLSEWEDSLTPGSMEKIVKEAGGPEHVAVISVDLIEGFCRVGPLASERVKGIIDPIVGIFKKAESLGVKNFVLTQDTHHADSKEFGSFPPHCIEGSEESKTVAELLALPFAGLFKVIPKDSISSGIGTELEKWLLSKNLKKIVVVGDCTDLCTYQLAMFLRLLANARGYEWDVILPAEAVETYDLPLDVARQIGAPAHPGDFFHVVFLYHMKLNGVNVISGII
jgi:nicotinamidase-related amidase